jgi:hypothetical protein
MKTFVHFDSTGAIHSLIAVDAPESVSAGVEPEPGIFVDEVEGVILNLDEPNIEAASEIADRYKVAPTPSRPRKLVKK